jgi:1,2-dihydroxy-3-keto-5-methylthiopentene dioxygenase
MAVVKIPDDNVTLTDMRDVQTFLAARGIEYEQWTASRTLAPDASPEEVLDAYDRQIGILKARGGYVTADVIDVKADTPNLDVMLARFNREHWHDEDEVRFILDGRGLFHINAGERAPGANGGQHSVFVLEVGPGDLTPRRTCARFSTRSRSPIRTSRRFSTGCARSTRAISNRARRCHRGPMTQPTRSVTRPAATPAG